MRRGSPPPATRKRLLVDDWCDDESEAGTGLAVARKALADLPGRVPLVRRRRFDDVLHAEPPVVESRESTHPKVRLLHCLVEQVRDLFLGDRQLIFGRALV